MKPMGASAGIAPEIAGNDGFTDSLVQPKRLTLNPPTHPSNAAPPQSALSHPPAAHLERRRQFCKRVRRQLRPQGIQERRLANRLGAAVWDACAAIAETPRRTNTRRLLVRAIAVWCAERERTRSRSPKHPREAPVHVEGLEWPDGHSAVFERGGTPPSCSSSGADWRSRLCFDTSDPCGAPLVRGTSVRASEIASLVRSGWTWRELLERFPELVEDDLRACLSYSIDASDAAEV